MILLWPLLKMMIVITVLFGLWLMFGGSVLFAFISVLITTCLLIRQQTLI